jgi:hypothetical protein
MEENHNNSIETLLERAGEYVKTTIELAKLKTLDKISDAISSVVSRTISIIFLVMFFLMGSIGISLLIGDALGKSWYGFIIVAGFYGLLALFLTFFLHNWLKKLIGNVIINKMYNNNNKEEQKDASHNFNQ